MPPKRTTTPMTDAAIEALIAQGVVDALDEYEAHKSSGNGDDSHDSGSLTQWFNKMEYVFNISNCTVACQIKFATCTLLRNALTWWNSHVKTVSHEAAYGMTWKTLKKMITDKYCPKGEIKKMFPEESDEVEKYVGGLPDMIQGSVMASKPKTMQEAIEFATELIDKKICTFADRQDEIKESLMTTQGTIRLNNNPSRSRMFPGLTLQGLVTRKSMEDPYPCALNVTIITKGDVHLGVTIARNLAIWPVNVGVLLLMLIHKEPLGRFRGFSLALRTNLNSNVVTSTFLLNNRYALILFDTGADRSFVSTVFCSLIGIIPTTLDHGYDVKLADELGSFDVITGCHVFLAHIIANKAEDKSEEKRLKDVPSFRDFPEIFPKDFSGIPPAQQVEFQIDLIPGAIPVARGPYRLSPSEMKEFSD
ncbi:putative reverse transcriptase domain-containing protein [Tanacetum coccineum]